MVFSKAKCCLQVAVPACLSKEHRAGLIAEHKSLLSRTADLRKSLEDKSSSSSSSSSSSFSLAQLDDLFALARFSFDAGNYGQAGELLASLRSLLPSSEHERLLGAAWGRLACDILLRESASDSLARLRELLDKSAAASNPALLLVQRAWLAHWSLFVLVGNAAAATTTTTTTTTTSSSSSSTSGAASSVVEAGLHRFLELVLQETMLNAIQATAPHLLRYVLLAAVVCGRDLRELVRVVEVERGQLASDPVVCFVGALYLDYDFDAALQHLAAAKTLLGSDYFAAGHAEAFAAAARQLVFRSYCRVYSSMDLGLLSAKLGLSNADTETYIVDLIRNEQDAKIDSASNQIVFAAAASPYQQRLLEKTQALQTQTALLQAQLQRTK